ncbi:hypothetical protein LVW35_15745 [Pseudomonas sp. HN11]|uniref:ABC transporter permease n=1 Tax=Pseudomonas sp. HN11 TaxID=1344094 RepID=UPI001F18B3C1|nr:ABC transporter permease subunit [Pseudomonas sp. HN11]UII69142.1 hypothetical protein LVW35_15745 [Pseudomonas sp. HN11]
MTSKTHALPLAAPVVINRSAWPRRLKGLVLPVLILLVLEVVVRVGWLPSYQMPAPSEIAVTLTDLAEGALWKHISASLGRVLLGFAIGASLAWMFLVAAELIAATMGLGYLLSDGRETSRPDIVLAAIIVLALLGKVSDGLLAALERRCLAWRDTFQGAGQ